MKIYNYDFFGQNKKSNHHPLLPSNIRCLIIGPANCGKTNLLFNFICNRNWLDYDRLYIYSNTLGQPKYQSLVDLFNETELVVGRPIGFFYNSPSDLIAPEELDSNYKNLIVFDDVLLDKQNNIERYFAQGRHSNADVFYCSQSYTRIPKQVVRDNANLLIVFPQDELNIKHIFENHVGCDMQFSEFKSLCQTCWQKPFSFLTIDKTKIDDKYKKMFTIIKKKDSDDDDNDGQQT